MNYALSSFKNPQGGGEAETGNKEACYVGPSLINYIIVCQTGTIGISFQVLAGKAKLKVEL